MTGRDLARAVRSVETPVGARLRQGIVDVADPLTVFVGGSTRSVPAVSLSSYAPAAGDFVSMLVDGGNAVVLGAVGVRPEDYYTCKRRSSGQVLTNLTDTKASHSIEDWDPSGMASGSGATSEIIVRAAGRYRVSVYVPMPTSPVIGFETTVYCDSVTVAEDGHRYDPAAAANSSLHAASLVTAPFDAEADDEIEVYLISVTSTAATLTVATEITVEYLGPTLA